MGVVEVKLTHQAGKTKQDPEKMMHSATKMTQKNLKTKLNCISDFSFSFELLKNAWNFGLAIGTAM